MDEDRFDRIEGKIDKLVDAVLKMAHLQGAVDRNGARITNIEETLRDIEKKMPLLDVMLKTIGKVGGTVVVLLVGGLVGGYFVL